MVDDMDINCGTIATGEASVVERSAEILDTMRTSHPASRPKARSWAYGDLKFVPWHIGAVM